MVIVHDEAMLKRYLKAAVDVSPERPILIDKFLENAIEVEADAIADGEVLGLANSFGLAFYKAQQAASPSLPLEGTVLITVADRDKPAVLEVARRFDEMGFKILATAGTHALLAEHGITSQPVLKTHEGRPNILDALTNGEIHLVINTPVGKESKSDDSYILHPQDGHQARGPLRHDPRGGRRRGQRHRRLPRRPRASQEPAGVPRRHSLTGAATTGLASRRRRHTRKYAESAALPRDGLSPRASGTQAATRVKQHARRLRGLANLSG
jgi:hypothetical protein